MTRHKVTLLNGDNLIQYSEMILLVVLTWSLFPKAVNCRGQQGKY